jgi:NAD(P)H-dependent flavin oxidoreductase YrpB (nitropropane dioxygenase family)
LGIDHPIVLAGMAGPTSADLVAAVTNAGGLGIMGVTGASPDQVAQKAAAIRERTSKPFGMNLLLHFDQDGSAIQAVLDVRPDVLSTAWPRRSQDLASIFAAAHDRGVKVVHMVSTVNDALTASAAGADVIVAQGTDGGGHIGLMGTMVIVPMVVRAVAPVPVLAAGGIADGHGLAASLALGASGVLVGTRFLATVEAGLSNAVKSRILASDGTDTIATDVGDILFGNDWPGALARLARNRLIERWLGRPNELRRHREEALQRLDEARKTGDVEEDLVYFGQDAGLIDEVQPAAEVVADFIKDAESALERSGRLRV